MLRLTSAPEGLDDEHASTAAGARTRQHAWFVGRRGLGCIGLFGAGRHAEQLARLGDVGGAVAVAGLLLLREAERKLGVCRRLALGLACAERGSSCAEDHFALILGAVRFCDAARVGFATIPLMSLRLRFVRR